MARLEAAPFQSKIKIQSEETRELSQTICRQRRIDFSTLLLLSF